MRICGLEYTAVPSVYYNGLLIVWTIFQLYYNTLEYGCHYPKSVPCPVFTNVYFLFYPCFNKEKRARRFVPVLDSLLVTQRLLFWDIWF